MRGIPAAACMMMIVAGVVQSVNAQTVEELRKSVEELSNRVTELEGQQDPAGTLRPYWKDGLRMESDDGSTVFKFGVNIQNDWAWISPNGSLRDDLGPVEDGVEFRRARFTAAGTINGNVEYKAEYDFAGGDADFKWVYIGLMGIPYVGTVRAGYMKEPVGLDFLTSNKKTIFMERALPINMAPQENTGVMVLNTLADDRVSYQCGVFRDTDGYGDNEGDGEYSVTGRLTCLPIYEDEGAHLLHLGASGSVRNIENDEFRLRARPETHLGQRFVDTGKFAVDDMSIVGGEFAIIWDSLLIQGEVIDTCVDADAVDDPEFYGYYMGASYLITGEHREYKTSSGVMDAVKPKENFSFSKDSGPGAWALTGRVSHLDLSDERIDGGELDTATGGVTWYLNPNTRIMCNYIYADPTGLNSGDAHIFQTRFQMAF